MSLGAFGRVDRSFFPDSTRPQFMVDFWLTQGKHIDDTSARAAKVETLLRDFEGVTHVSTLVGAGAITARDRLASLIAEAILKRFM